VVIRKAVKEDAKTLVQLIKLKAEFDRSMKGFSGEVSNTVEKLNVRCSPVALMLMQYCSNLMEKY